jgi:hypothetical protein
MDDTPRYWFSAKRFGLGWRTPLTWEGWAVDLTWLASCIAIARYLRSPDHPLRSLGLFFSLIAFFVCVRHWKGEPGQ